MIQYPQYQKEEKESKFLKVKLAIPNEGNEIRLKMVSAAIEDGKFGKQLKVNVLWMNPETGKPEAKEFSVDAPNEKNKFTGSQIYRGLVDNNIQENDVFYIQNGGRMNNEYHTVIYNILKDGGAKPATVEQVKQAFNPEPQVEVTPAPSDEDINIEDIPF